MFRALLITTALTAASASAQGVDVAPITLDVEGEEALVVAAVAAPTGPNIPGAAPSPIIPAAARVTGGRPQPSIILGLIEPGQEASFGVENLLSSTVEEVLFDIDDLAAREALRESDPDLFRQLIEEGYLDLPEDQLARQLQIELARMNCYTSTIDGIWGRGSRGSVTRYFEEVGASRSDLEPSNNLLRTILITGDRECPEEAPAPTPAASNNSSSSSSSGTRTQTTRTQSQPTRTQTQQPTRTESTGTPRMTIGGSGVFR